MHFFPNRELYLDTGFLVKIARDTRCIVALRFEGSDDLVALRFLKMTLDDMGFSDVSLKAPFFPYSTMDHSDESRPLSLKYYAAEVNSLGFRTVDVMEPHSSVLAALVDRLKVTDGSAPLARRVLQNYDSGDLLICFPDAGAEKRYCEDFPGMRTATFQKKRDFATGEITGMRCLDSLDGIGPQTTAIIVDDLCRGGRTFVECGKLIRDAGVGHVILCVTHVETGVFQSGILEDGIVDEIYATDSCLPVNHQTHPKLHITYMFEKESCHV